MAPSSRFASSLKPNVAYLDLNFCALWKKQTTLPSLAYAGIPYQVFGERAGALALMTAWSRWAMARSGSGISAIFASTSLSPSALSARGPRRASWARSFIAARSSSVNPADFSLITMVLLADFCVAFLGLMETSSYGLGWKPRRSSHADPRYSNMRRLKLLPWTAPVPDAESDQQQHHGDHPERDPGGRHEMGLRHRAGPPGLDSDDGDDGDRDCSNPEKSQPAHRSSLRSAGPCESNATGGRALELEGPSPLRGFWWLGFPTWGSRPRLYASAPSGLSSNGGLPYFLTRPPGSVLTEGELVWKLGTSGLDGRPSDLEASYFGLAAPYFCRRSPVLLVWSRVLLVWKLGASGLDGRPSDLEARTLGWEPRTFSLKLGISAVDLLAPTVPARGAHSV